MFRRYWIDAGVGRRPQGRWVLVATLLALCGVLLSVAPILGAERYPSRPITWIVSFSPGGNSDIEVRRLQPILENRLGVRILVEYRPGAGGAIGWAELARSRPDGYTVGGLVLPHMVIQTLTRVGGYSLNDIQPVVFNVTAPQALMVRSDSPYRTLEDFIRQARENPGRVSVGGVDTLSASELAFAQLRRAAGIDIVYVPITGGAGPLTASLLGGHVDAAITSAPHGLRNEGIRVLAVAGESRLDAAPDVPTFLERGYRVTVASTWGVGVPAGTPQDVVNTLFEAIRAAMESPSVAEAVEADGLQRLVLDPEASKRYVDDLVAEYRDLLQTLRSEGQK